ncbi:hypothetical protein SKAU_G00393370 [Synaphobranchus kaupii]|uniref:Uncharacterized protein n=1 Tax=Synaphobranchus kaupii TaxID=118154 RepID=A0A9Q1EBZ5_SYNKA|nr:hypothetical protein SKAU_G00393370 [Synaphobranchus kaupii]
MQLSCSVFPLEDYTSWSGDQRNTVAVVNHRAASSRGTGPNVVRIRDSSSPDRLRSRPILSRASERGRMFSEGHVRNPRLQSIASPLPLVGRVAGLAAHARSSSVGDAASHH